MNTNRAALERIINDPAYNNDAKAYALEELTVISRASEVMKLSTGEILSALADGHAGTLSAVGLYFQTSAFITKYLGPIGGLLLMVVGMCWTVNVIRKGTTYVVSKLATIVSSLVTISTTSGSAVTGLLKLLIGSISSAKDADDLKMQTDGLLVGFSMAVPPPVGVMVNMINSLMESESLAVVTPSSGPSTLGTPSQLMSSLSNPSVNQTILPVIQPVPVNPTVAANAPVTPSEQSQVSGVWGALESSGLMNTVLKGIFSDEDGVVRDAVSYQDHNPFSYQDGVVRDEETIKAALASAAALGMDPRRFARVMKAALQNRGAITITSDVH